MGWFELKFTQIDLFGFGLKSNLPQTKKRAGSTYSANIPSVNIICTYLAEFTVFSIQILLSIHSFLSFLLIHVVIDE